MEKSTPLFIGGAFLTGLALGAVSGAKFVERKLTLEFEERLEKETDAVRAFYGIKKEFATPGEAVEKLIPPAVVEAMNAYQGDDKHPVAYHKIVKSEKTDSEIIEEVEQFDEVVNNVFEKTVDHGPIYIITPAEFEQNETDYIQQTLTWYEKDNVLTDAREDKIEEPDKVVGLIVVRDFLENQEDPHVLHVRNETLQLDFEVLRSEKYYAVEVLGMDEPIERPSQRIRGG